MAAIDNDGRNELQSRVRNPLEHLYDKLSNLEITLDRDYKRGSKVKIDAFTLADGGEVFGSIYEFFEEMDGWSTPGNPKAPSVTIDGKMYQEKA